MDEASPAPTAEPAAKATPWALVALGVGAVVAIGAVIATVMLVSGPRPDATLELVAEEPDVEILAILAAEEQWAAIVTSTLQGYEPYGSVEVWSATNGFGSPCLIAFERETRDVVSTSCIPEPAELFIDIAEHGLPDGGRTRFVSSGSTLEVHVYLPEGAE